MQVVAASNWERRNLMDLPSQTRVVRSLIGLLATISAGLTGAYDFTLKWNPSLAAGAADRVSIFTALQEQLGLKLEPRRKAVDVVAIKRIERPTEN